MKYLEIKFHDNDFCNPMRNALERLWKWVQINNCQHDTVRTIPDMFMELHNHGILSEMFHRLWVLETLSNSVEFATRGLHYEKIYWGSSAKFEKSLADELKFYENYLRADIEFHENGDFMTKWYNAEHGALDLWTGETYIF